MDPLAINLAIIFGTRLFLNNFLDVLLPWFSWRNKLKVETSGVEEVRLTPAEEDFLLLPYDSLLESINAYADTAIQYGYALLFVTALPIATFCSLINNWARVKFYLYKLFKVAEGNCALPLEPFDLFLIVCLSSTNGLRLPEHRTSGRGFTYSSSCPWRPSLRTPV